MPVGHFTESQLLVQEAVSELVLAGYKDKSILGTVLTDYSYLVDENHLDKIILPRLGKFDDLVEPTIVGCNITDVCQNLSIDKSELTANLKAYLCWEFSREFDKKNFPKDKIIERALEAGYKKATKDLITAISTNIVVGNTFDGTGGAGGTGDLLDAVYQAEAHLVDSGVQHNQANSFILGDSAFIRRLRQLKAVTQCCGEFVNPIGDVIGAVAGFTVVQVPSNYFAIPNQALVVNKESGGWALFDSIYKKLAETSVLCDKYAWLQTYGINIYGSEYVAAINYAIIP